MKNAYIIVGLIVIGSILTYLVYNLLSTPFIPWLFKGAYATYEGKGTLFGFISGNMTIRLELVDFNNTHAKILMYIKIQTILTKPEEYQNTTWVDLSDKSYKIEGWDLNRTYEDYIYFEDLDTTRYSVIYEYNMINATDTKMIFYTDKRIGFPLKIVFASPGIDLELKLVDTNVSDLKKK